MWPAPVRQGDLHANSRLRRRQIGAVQAHGEGDRRGFDDLGAAAHFGRFWRAVQVQDDDFVAAMPEPLARQEK